MVVPGSNRFDCAPNEQLCAFDFGESFGERVGEALIAADGPIEGFAGLRIVSRIADRLVRRGGNCGGG